MCQRYWSTDRSGWSLPRRQISSPPPSMPEKGEDDDDRDGNAQQPEQNVAHSALLSSVVRKRVGSVQVPVIANFPAAICPQVSSALEVSRAQLWPGRGVA